MTTFIRRLRDELGSLALAPVQPGDRPPRLDMLAGRKGAAAHPIDEQFDARLAVHDIGALGFYAPNPVIDMAGLITPAVVDFIRDETRLAEYLDANSVDYLITFPSFYPELTSKREILFKGGLDLHPGDLGESIGVYRWR